MGSLKENEKTENSALESSILAPLRISLDHPKLKELMEYFSKESERHSRELTTHVFQQPKDT